MSALEFLRVDAAAPQGAFLPVARSALDRLYRAAGAGFAERDGWLVPASVPGEAERLEAVGLADLSHLTKLELRPAGEPIDLEGVVWYRISPRRALVLCHAALTQTVRERAGDRLVLDVTGGLAVLAIVGPEAETVLRRLTHLHHLPSGGEVAHVTAHVLRAGNGYWIVVAQELGEYLADVALDRAEALGGGLVGVDRLGAAS